ncbi:amino acid permease [Desulforamulus aeronauticus]|uniref:Basic amino acid/polyamine antiporter, APA family n=1 Tax=Desulforamulus aeronauticus DSM 10349 TaxID=1121421 RepID=A0A1M6QPJ5_9FIRM|nr:amino acid permease [Desulforamulus aeronauticus]SHK22181.1 basic amino acid/polyamine antiporter, APA family [Desulforamulus aeronauticus DSM 10349]
MSLFRKKSLEELLNSSGRQQLSRVLGPLDLTMLGIGAVIGTGIFVLTGVAAAQHAGPALTLSFVIAGLACVFAALCYAEFSSTVPVAGSVYSYSYFTLGEIVAWLIGWDLVLEYGLAVSAVAVGWSGYFQNLIGGFGIHLPVALTGAPGSAPGAVFNLPSFLIILGITWLLSKGIRESARVNNIMVLIKVAVVLVFIAVGVWYVKPANWSPFMPFGFNGVMTGAATIFFAYLGFDAVSTAAEEVKNPKRDLPIGIIGSLTICTILYIAVSAILTGIVPYAQLDVAAPVAFAMNYIGQNWFAGLISLGAICGITTVLLVMAYGQIRLFFAMSRDGLIPSLFSKVHPKYKTPYTSTWLTGLGCATVSALVPLGTLAHLVNIGTLSAFVLVSVAVLVLRKTHPHIQRSFTCPGVPLIPILAILFCGYLMISLPAITWKMFCVWMVLGIVVYLLYGKGHSKLATKGQSDISANL